MAPAKRSPSRSPKHSSARSFSGRPATRKGRSRQVVLLLVIGGVLLVLLLSRRAPPPAVASGVPHLRLPELAALDPQKPPAFADRSTDTAVEPDLAALPLERAQRTLDSYVQATKYPPTSRPLSEHPDQIEPLNKVDHRQFLVPGGQSRLRLRYDRSFLVGDDAVVIRLSGEDSVGNPLPCEIISASATEAPFSPDAGRHSAVTLSFASDGHGGGAVAGTFTTRFQPARQGFARHLGGIRIAVRARVGDEEGATGFDVYYTPTPPAVFTRAVREVLENGSLSLYLGINVHKAGHYIITARVDDSTGNGFAYLSFNDEVQEGTREIPLVLFGKLIRDRHAHAPFQLRDVEGFLLKEDTDPDRELVQPLLGTVHTTQAYPESAFSDMEWQSEQRTRTIDEFTRNLEDLKKQAAGAR
jgi:hypothetical protein